MIKAIKKLKYRLVTDLVEELVEVLVARLKTSRGQLWPDWGKEWVLVPVPLFPLRERKRGFNQAAVLGGPVAKRVGWQFEPLLIRQKPTLPQAEIEDKRERWLNIRGAFALNQKINFKFKNQKIIVFDDVWTTGNTIKECAQVLKRAGANQVWGLTLSR
jgi:ComF family protein